MSCETPDVVGNPEPPEVRDLGSAFRRCDTDQQNRTDIIDGPSDHAMSISEEGMDHANDDDTVQYGSETESRHVSSDLDSDNKESAGENAESSGSTSEDEDMTDRLKDRPKRVNIKWSDYESFKNRFSPEEGLDIIEVLQGHPDHLKAEILHERSKRRRKKHSGLRSKGQVEDGPKTILGVRIQSPEILHILGRLTAQEDWDDQATTFLRPFQAFYYSLPLSKRVLKVLEREFGERQSHDEDQTPEKSPMERSIGASSIETDDPLQKMSISQDVDIEDIVYGLPDFNSQAGGSLIAMEHMKLYIGFVESYIVPMWVEARGSSKRKVRFADLPMYFRPGDIVVYEPYKRQTGISDLNAIRNEGLAVHQNYWKLLCATFREPVSRESYRADLPPRLFRRRLSLDCFHIDFDGDVYGTMQCSIDLHTYEGELDIQSLDAFPLRFSADAKQKSKELSTRGEKFFSHIRERHLSYDGWTLIHATYFSEMMKNEQQSRAEHIEGEVMIDFKEGFQSASGFLKPVFRVAPQPEGLGTTSMDPLLSSAQWDMPIQWWSDTGRSKRKGNCGDVYVTMEPYYGSHYQHIKEEDKVLNRDVGMDLLRSDRDMDSMFNPEHLLIFPQRLIAYSFRARKFFVANIDYISGIPTPESPFRELKIESENKRILKSLVGRHFEKQNIRRQSKDANFDHDFIRGKGSGLVILLHGVPGVGKTTTAEAVALDNHKPLFALTSGDLGSTSKDVEIALGETFRLAALWDCVLLLDEADLFLAKRDVGDLVRNSLASVFLRVLDYYDGVLFLTTNRVGTVDEAFRSRIHLSLYYPPLRRKQAMEIFKLNLRRIKEIEKSKAELHEKRQDDQWQLPPIEIDESSILNFATRQWESTKSNPSRRWNGRQIRNSFQVAYSLVNLGQISAPTSHWDDDYDDEDVDYDDEPETDVSRSKGQNLGSNVTSPTATVQVQRAGKLDSSQFEIVERSIRRFDSYLDRTRGPDSDYAKSRNLRRDDFAESEDEERLQWSHGRYYYPGSPSHGSNYPSSTSASYLAPPSDRGGRTQRAPARGREQRIYRARSTPMHADDDENYGEEMPRSRGGGDHRPFPRSKRREYDDEYGYT